MGELASVAPLVSDVPASVHELGPRTSSPGCCGLRASPVDMGSWQLAAGGSSNACRRGLIQRGIQMKAIVVTDQAAGTAGMKLVERPEPEPATNDVVVQVH